MIKGKKSFVWKLLLVIGVCPFIAPLFYYLLLHLMHNDHSWTWIELLVLWSVVYWPTYLIGLFLLAISLYKLKK